MPKFNFDSLSVSTVLTELLNTIPLSVTSFNFLIVGNTLIIPLGDYPKDIYSSRVRKKDTASSEMALTAMEVQGGSTIISQRVGDQIKVSASVSLNFFKELFNFGGDFIQVPAVGIVDSLFKFAYTFFTDTDCILIDQTGIRGVGAERLRIVDWNRSADPKDPDRMLLDMQFSFEPPKSETPPKTYEVDEDAVNSALS